MEATKTANEDLVFSATYNYPADGNEVAYNTISAAQDAGPQTLKDIIDTCLVTGASAELHDEAGFVTGWVHADGNYRLQ